jgi:Holliday junction DNA helicase RuvB
MDELEKVLSTFVNQAKDAMRIGDYDRAIDRMRNAMKCAVLGAEKASPVNKAKYINFAKSFKETIAQLEAKRDEVARSKAPDRPSAPTSSGEPSAPKAPSSDRPAPKKDESGDSGKSSEKSGGPSRAPDRNDALRPLYLSDYIGQPGAVMAVRDLITAARLKDDSLPHLIVYGSHGLGKTTFAKIIANEMRANFIEVNASKITPAEMIAILKKIERKDIVFIDEIHTVPLVVAESILYSAMQDGRITYTEGKGATAKTKTIELPRFTLIGATTEIGKLAKPFTQRAVQVRLEEYTDEVLASIITSSFYKLGLKINPENSLFISKRCRNNPRIANSHVRRISDKALVRYAMINNLTSAGAFSTPDAIRALGIEVSDKVIEEFFKENGIDEWGLEKGDRVLLDLIIKRYNGGPVGLDTLARAMNEANNVISQKYEAYLIKKGMLRVDRDGRVAMAAAYVALGLPVPDNKKEDNDNGAGAKNNAGAGGSSASGNNNESGNTPSIDDYNKSINPKYEKKTMIVCHVPEEFKVKKIEDLIVYPENVATITDELDDLFPDI